MRVTEAIILAGGLGTRLRAAVPDLPKAMAPVAGRPFLSFVIDTLRMQGIQTFIFSLGYGAATVLEYLEKHYPTLDYRCSIEEEPLGTGGAIRLSLQQCRTNTVLVTNGDTLFRVSVPQLARFHEEKGAACTLALKPMKDFDRYGVVEVGADGSVSSFREKQFYAEGWINGGMYILDRERFLLLGLPPKFSFEKDYLELQTGKGQLFGLPQDGYFIDIGIPEDFRKAGEDLNRPALDLTAVDRDWTLFLDRDGVINDEQPGTYILNKGGFRFSPGVLEAFPVLRRRFGKIVIVTNQRGVGRRLMTEQDLDEIHSLMVSGIREAGGGVDALYYCTSMDNKAPDRKPNPGMALQAGTDHPEIDLSKAIMVGNNLSDMQFGRAAGLYTVFVTTTNPEQSFPHPDIDLIFPSLADFAEALQS